MNSHSPEQVVSLFGEHGTYEAPGTGGPISDGQLVWFLGRVWDGWKDLTFTAQRVSTQGNQVIIAWRSFAKHNNAPVTGEGVTVLDIEDTHIRRARTHFGPLPAPSVGVPAQVQ